MRKFSKLTVQFIWFLVNIHQQFMMHVDSKNINDYCAGPYLLVLGGHGVGVEPLLEVWVVRLRHRRRLLLLLLLRRRPDPGDLSGLPNIYTHFI